MYKIEMSDKADKDLEDIFDYISDELFNPLAAIDLMDTLEETIQRRLEQFPYAYPVHTFLESLGIEYRRTIIENFTVFYRIVETEKEKMVIVNHIVYSARDVEKIVVQDSEWLKSS